MTDGKTERTMQFILEQQAQNTVSIGQLADTMSNLSGTVDKLSGTVDKLSAKVDRTA